MLPRLLALLLCLLAVLPSVARGATHRCGETLIAAADCACEHGDGWTVADTDDCCELRSAPAPDPLTPPAVGPHPPLALLVPEVVVPVPPAPEAYETPAEARPWAPVRGPPRVPIFLRHRALLS